MQTPINLNSNNNHNNHNNNNNNSCPPFNQRCLSSKSCHNHNTTI